jgi:hypothetical protein
MTGQPDNKALTQWTKSAISYKNYQDFIDKKNERFKLTLIDLLYISNFKGGNGTINEPESTIEYKLTKYSKILIDINEKFKSKTLHQLSDIEIDKLIILITSICNLTHKTTATKIDGFGISYLSALLSSYFPELIPILDRRVLMNLTLVTTADIDKYGQIKNIQRFYEQLVKKFAQLCKEEQLSVREFDKYLFTTTLTKPKD